jgi:hypothetical protein
VELEQAVWPNSWKGSLLSLYVQVGISIGESLDSRDNAADLISLGPPEFCDEGEVIRIIERFSA